MEEYTGGSVNYYRAEVKNPTTAGIAPYSTECNDLIEALELTPAEANVFKAIWRRAAARQGKMKRGYTDGVYDAEKMVFFSERILTLEKAKSSASRPLLNAGQRIEWNGVKATVLADHGGETIVVRTDFCDSPIPWTWELHGIKCKII